VRRRKRSEKAKRKKQRGLATEQEREEGQNALKRKSPDFYFLYIFML